MDEPNPIPYWRLLTGVNRTQNWRRLKLAVSRSRLHAFLMGLFVVGYAFLAFGLFHKGLQFTSSFPGLGPVLIERMMFLLFAFLFLLLLLSNVIINFTNLFRNRETHFLLTLPVPHRVVYRWKIFESGILASWAFLFLIAPLVIAYGTTHNAPWHFYLVTPLFVALFVVLPGVLGGWAALGLARWLDRLAFQVAAMLVVVLVIVIVSSWLQPETVTDEMLETRVLDVVDRLLARTRFSLFPYLPSYWVSSGLTQWVEGALMGTFFFGLVLLSHTMFFGYLAMTKSGGIFFASLSAVNSRGASAGWKFWKRGSSTGQALGQGAFAPKFLDRLAKLFWWGRADSRSLIIKDIRTFWRDTTQWGQSLVLLGLLVAYILNLRHFSHRLTSDFWIDLTSYLNLGACALNLATLTTRFVFPQISLEGKRVWIVGMAPLGMRRTLLTKFLFSTAVSMTVTMALVGTSCAMLSVPVNRIVYFTVTVGVMSFTLNALAIGLGALYPNFREDNPSKIVSGFGGTLCLVLSFLYIVGMVTLMAMTSRWAFGGSSIAAFWAGWVVFLCVSFLLGWLPLRSGIRKMSTLEV
jgi:ABC-2 type transport system permease protein